MLLELPAEVTIHILRNLDASDLCRVSKTCSYLQTLVSNSGELWKQMCLRYEIDYRDIAFNSVQAHFILNYPKHNYIKRWKSGLFSSGPPTSLCYRCKSNSQSRQNFALDVDTWGKILDCELARSQ